MISISYPVNDFSTDPDLDKLDEIPILLSFYQLSNLFNDELTLLLDLQILIKFAVYRVFSLYV